MQHKDRHDRPWRREQALAQRDDVPAYRKVYERHSHSGRAREPAMILNLTETLSWCESGPSGTTTVPQIEVSEQQILGALDRLSPKGRRQALRRLIAGAPVLDRTIDALQPRLAEIARQRGLDWAKLSDEERERLVDHTLHD